MLEDRLLVWKLRHGSREALRTIYRKYASDLLTVAANLLSTTDAAEDIVQDVFVSFLQSAERFRLRTNLKGYLATCVANRARDRMRRAARRRTIELSGAGPIQSNAKSPVQMVISGEQMRRLSDAMAELPYEQREVIVLRLHGDMRFRQIAASQGVSIKTVLSRYRYGLRKLRSRLNGEVIR